MKDSNTHGAGPRDRDGTIFLKRAPIEVPLNLAEWIEPRTLASWIREEIGKLDRTRPQFAEFFSHPPESRPEAFVAVLVFAYATQVFSSDEIARACHTDPILHELCAEVPPDRHQLDHFRRNSHFVLEDILGQVLVRAVKEKFVTEGQLPPGLQHSLFGRASDRVHTARHMDTWSE